MRNAELRTPTCALRFVPYGCVLMNTFAGAVPLPRIAFVLAVRRGRGHSLDGRVLLLTYVRLAPLTYVRRGARRPASSNTRQPGKTPPSPTVGSGVLRTRLRTQVPRP